jgi:hypothetical protein
MATTASNKPYRVGRSRTGLGLFATKPIKKGTKIVRYFGPLLDSKKKKEDAIENKYLFELTNRWTIDGSVRANVARYINHACKPNAESDVKPRKRKVIIRAIKNIEPGDEINYDYGTDYFKAYLKPIGCKCDACEKKRKKKRAEARAEKLRLKARAERKALKEEWDQDQPGQGEWRPAQRQVLERPRPKNSVCEIRHSRKTPAGRGKPRLGLDARLPHRCRQRRIPEVDGRALNDRAGLIDDHAKAPVLGEKRQAMPALIRVDPALPEAGDASRAHPFLEPRQRDAEAFGDDRRVDLNGAIGKFDSLHATPRA